MKYLLLISIILTACGADEPNQDQANEYALPEGQGKAAEGDYGSFMVEGKYALPECNNGMESALAYVKEIAGFMTCDGTEWVEVELEGLDPDYYRYKGDWYYLSKETSAASYGDVCPKNHKMVTGDLVQEIFEEVIVKDPFWGKKVSRQIITEESTANYPLVYKTYQRAIEASSQVNPLTYIICKKNTGA